MKLESQVCSLELAKELKSLGVPQDSLFAYYLNGGESTGAIVDMGMYSNENQDFKSEKLISAFTVAELGEMLSTKENHNTIRTTVAVKQWGCDYESYRTFGDTEADARAKCLIYLIKNDLYTPLNKNL